MACFMVRCAHCVAFFFLLSAAMTTYLYVDTRTNTSFKIASVHTIALYNYGCVLSNGTRFYIVPKDVNGIDVIDRVADSIYGVNANGDKVIYSLSTQGLSSNQVLQYTTKMPYSDDYGLYFEKCAKITDDAVGQVNIAWAVTLIMFVLMFIAYVLTYYLFVVKCSSNYENIA
ncbi:unnamed protein product [Macrosiphum euphorbiae]|uniref:Uncharacterized protein n=1 Tax=Macrosiphum euphorbiae TaxID=13131 RepID=A0AAV0WRQ3_9HEMI|nr:unnamed protein product [Macrosiphum euphorbiae]